MEQADQGRSLKIFAMGMAALIIGAGLIYVVSSSFGMPGMKYLLMSPFLAVMAYVMTYFLNYRWLFLKIGLIFAGVMVFINVYMPVAILSSGLVTDLLLTLIRQRRNRPLAAGIIYSMTCVLSSLSVAKYLVRGHFADVSLSWMFMASLVAIITGAIGAYLAREFTHHVSVKAVNKSQ